MGWSRNWFVGVWVGVGVGGRTDDMLLKLLELDDGTSGFAIVGCLVEGGD